MRLDNLTCMSKAAEELWDGAPRSVAMTVKLYSAFSARLRGDEERSSPVFGFKEKRSALEP